MDLLRMFKRRVLQVWQSFVDRVWPQDPDGDYFRLMNLELAFAASRFEPQGPHQQTYWKWYRLFCWYHTVCTFLNAIEHLDQWDDFSSTVWYMAISVELIIPHVKDLILHHHSEAIKSAQIFINGKLTSNSDNCYDFNARKGCFRYIRIMCFAIFLVACAMLVMMYVPNAQVKALFKSPDILQLLGPGISDGFYYLFSLTLPYYWPCKIICSSALAMSLLVGLETEYSIFANGLGNILDEVKSDISTDSKDPLYEEKFFKHLKPRVHHFIEHHIELLDNIQQLEPFVKDLFLVFYYHTMILIGTYVFVVLKDDISVGTVMIVLAVVVYMIKCYFWCRLINSFEDINDIIEQKIMEMITMMPHSVKNHMDYVGLRSSLMIMKIRTRKTAQFSCGGVFNISVEVFGKLLNITYSVLTFLLDTNK